MNDVLSSISSQTLIVTTIPYLKKTFTDSTQRYVYSTHPNNLIDVFKNHIKSVENLRQTLIKQYPKLFH